MRGALDDLVTPKPLAGLLPAMLAYDPFVARFCAGLDDVLAPIFATLAGFPAYLDPGTTPEDMLGWLAAWVGLAAEEGQPAARRRELVRAGVDLLPWRGTVRGVRGAVEAAFGVTPEIEESGGAAWSVDPQESLPGREGARLVVRLRLPDPDPADERRLGAVVTAVKPVHVAHDVSVIKG